MYEFMHNPRRLCYDSRDRESAEGDYHAMPFTDGDATACHIDLNDHPNMIHLSLASIYEMPLDIFTITDVYNKSYYVSGSRWIPQPELDIDVKTFLAYHEMYKEFERVTPPSTRYPMADICTMEDVSLVARPVCQWGSKVLYFGNTCGFLRDIVEDSFITLDSMQVLSFVFMTFPSVTSSLVSQSSGLEEGTDEKLLANLLFYGFEWIKSWILEKDGSFRVVTALKTLLGYMKCCMSDETFKFLSEKISEISSFLSIEDMSSMYASFFLKWEAFRSNKYAEQFIKIHCYVLTFLLSPTGFEDTSKVFSERAGSKINQFLSARDGFSCMFDAMTYCANAVSTYSLTGDLSGLYETHTILDEVDKTFIIMDSICKASQIGDSRAFDLDDRAVLLKLESYINDLNAARAVAPPSKIATLNRYALLMQQYKVDIDSKLSGMQDKIAPFMFRLQGSSGVSKSHLTFFILQVLMEACEYPTDEQYIKHLNISEIKNFVTRWSNYILAVILDDVDHGVPDKEDATADFRLRAGNNAPHLLTGASLQEKGRLFDNAVFYVENTNSVNGNAHHYSLFPSAEARRVHVYINVTVKEEYKMASTDGDIKQPRIDYSKVADPTDPARDCWEFTLTTVEIKEADKVLKTEFGQAIPRERDDEYRHVVVVYNGIPMEKVGIKPMLDFMITASRKHFALQKSVLSSNSNVRSTNFTCPTCRYFNCRCGRISKDCIGQATLGIDKYWNDPQYFNTKDEVIKSAVIIQSNMRGVLKRLAIEQLANKVLRKYLAMRNSFKVTQTTHQTLGMFLNKYYPEYTDQLVYAARGSLTSHMKTIVTENLCKYAYRNYPHWREVLDRQSFVPQSLTRRTCLRELVETIQNLEPLKFQENLKEAMLSIQDVKHLLHVIDSGINKIFADKFAKVLSSFVGQLFEFLEEHDFLDLTKWIPSAVYSHDITVKAISQTGVVQILSVLDLMADILYCMYFNFTRFNKRPFVIAGIRNDKYITHALLQTPLADMRSFSMDEFWRALRKTRMRKKRELYAWWKSTSCYKFVSSRTQSTAKSLLDAKSSQAKYGEYSPLLTLALPRILGYLRSNAKMQYCDLKSQSSAIEKYHGYDNLDYTRFRDFVLDDVPTRAKSRPGELPRSVRNNIFHVSTVGATVPACCNMIGLCNEIAILPKHYAEKFLGRTIVAHRKEFDPCNPSNSRFYFVLDTFNCLSHPDADFTFVRVPTMGDVKDITIYLPDDENFKEVEPLDIIGVLHRDEKGRMTSIHKVRPTIRGKVLEKLSRVCYDTPQAHSFTRGGFKYQLSSPTFKGLCGAIVFSLTRKDTFIYGLHMAGVEEPGIFGSNSDVGIGCCVTLLKSDVDLAISHFELGCAIGSAELNAFKYYEKSDFTPELHNQSYLGEEHYDGNFRVLGTISKMVTFSPTVINTPIAGRVREEFSHEWSWSNPYHRGPGDDSRYTIKRIFSIMSKHDAHVPAKLLRQVEDDTLADWKECLPLDIVPLTREEIVNGSTKDYVNSMPMQTSMGMCMSGKKSKYATQRDDGSWVFEDVVWKEFDRRLNLMQQGMRIYMLFNAFHKDEATEQKKIDKKKTRLFYACDGVDQMIIRYLLQNFIHYVLMARDKLGICVGINPHSPEWNTLGQKFRSDSDVVELDHENFDANVSAQKVISAMDTIIRYVSLCPSYPEKDLIALRVLKYEMAYPCINFNGDVVMMSGAIMSGSNLTSIIGSIINIMSYKLVYFDIGFVNRFSLNCTLAVYGDDSLFQANRKVKSFMTMISIIEKAGRMGFPMTPGNKASDCPKFVKFSDCTFIKRKFLWNSRYGLYVAPLVEQSLFKQLSALRKPKHVTIESQTGNNMSNALFEIKFHGKRKFEKWKSVLCKIAAEHDLLEYFELRDVQYNELMEAWSQKYGIDEGWFSVLYSSDKITNLLERVEKFEISGSLEEEQ